MKKKKKKKKEFIADGDDLPVDNEMGGNKIRPHVACLFLSPKNTGIDKYYL